MLRGVLGDSVFFDCLYDYANDPEFMYAQATIEEFRQLCEDISGEDLLYFFDEWIYDEYYPNYHFNFENLDIGIHTIERGLIPPGTYVYAILNASGEFLQNGKLVLY